MSESMTLEGVRRADGRIALFDGDAFVGHLPAPNGNGKAGARRPATVKPSRKSAAVEAGERGKNTGMLRRCEACGAKTKRTICPNGHRVANDPD